MTLTVGIMSCHVLGGAELRNMVSTDVGWTSHVIRGLVRAPAFHNSGEAGDAASRSPRHPRIMVALS